MGLIYLKIPQANYEPLRASLDAELGYPSEFVPTSLIPNKPVNADGDVYVAVPSKWPTDLISQYVVDQAIWKAAIEADKPKFVETTTQVATTT